MEKGNEMETIIIDVMVDNARRGRLFRNLADRINALVGEEVPRHENYVVSKVLSIAMDQPLYDSLAEYWEVHALVVAEVRLAGLS